MSKTPRVGSAALSQLVATRFRRIWEDAHLPVYGTLLGYDMLLLLAQLHFEQRDVSLKQIYLSLRYSENAVRLQLQKLGRDGWIKLERGTDRRFRRVVPQARLCEAFASYLDLLSDPTLGEMLPATNAESRRRHRSAPPFSA